jgi:hypothetical protein
MPASSEDGSMPDLPQNFAETVRSLHMLAFHVLAPARHAAENRLGLEAAPHGFGTPWFATSEERRRLRMELDELVVESEGTSRRTRPVDLASACAFAEVDFQAVWYDDFHDPPPPMDPTRRLVMDVDAARVVADWFALGSESLTRVSEAAEHLDPGRLTLWPEHFDIATELGHESGGARAGYGASPGDPQHDEPYLYVAPWDKDRAMGTFWNDHTFGGASMPRHVVLAAADPTAAAAGFFRRGLDLLTSAP